VWLATSILGILTGGVLWALDLRGAADVAWTVTTTIALASLLRDVVRGLMRRQAGVDVVAVLAMGGSLALEQYLAGAVIALMLATGEASRTRIVERTGSCRRCSSERRAPCPATRTVRWSSAPWRTSAGAIVSW
jgi:cation transport ATPase